MKALLAAAALALPGVPAKPPTIPQARMAIHHNWQFASERIYACKIVGVNVMCKVSSAGCYDDDVFGPSLFVATDIVGVGPRRRVFSTAPTTFDIYPGCPKGVGP